MILPTNPPADYLPDPCCRVPDPSLAVFDGVLSALQSVPREVAAYVLPMISPVLNEVSPEYPDIFRTVLDLPPPDDAPPALRYWQAVRDGDETTATMLMQWLDEAGALPLVREAMTEAETIISAIRAVTQSGQEADSSRGTAP